jgi:hypothetical protein
VGDHTTGSRHISWVAHLAPQVVKWQVKHLYLYAEEQRCSLGWLEPRDSPPNSLQQKVPQWQDMVAERQRKHSQHCLDAAKM